MSMILTFQFLYAYFNKFPLNKPAENPIGKLAGYSASIITSSLGFPIVIAKGLNGFPKEIILNNNSKWPRGIGKIILGFFLRLTGTILWGCSVYLALDTEKEHQLVLTLEHFVTAFYITFLYSFPIILVGILVENFKEVCQHQDNDEIRQILFITWTFNSFTQLLEDRPHQLYEYIVVLGCIVGLGMRGRKN